LTPPDSDAPVGLCRLDTHSSSNDDSPIWQPDWYDPDWYDSLPPPNERDLPPDWRIGEISDQRFEDAHQKEGHVLASAIKEIAFEKQEGAMNR